MAGEPILVVDDNPTNLKLVRIILEGAGFAVRTTTNAESVREILNDYRPAVILMDIQLPGIDGLELTRRLKDDPFTCDIRIVALTSYAMKGDEEKARAAGCDGYITKPIDTRSLAATVRGHVAAKSASPGTE